MNKLLLNITHGFQARMLLRSRIAEELLGSGADLVVVSESCDDAYFRREFDHPQITLEPMPLRTSVAEKIVRRLRQQLLMNPAMGQTLNFKNEQLRVSSPVRYWLGRTGNSVLGRAPALRKAYLAAEAMLFDGKEFRDLLERHRPDLIVTGTPGYNIADIHLLRMAKRLGVPTATVMLSWDNLTSKGYMGATPDSLLVWSNLMADEAVEYHDYPRDRIIWTGAAQFDHYHGVRDRLDRAAWRLAHGVPTGAAMIVYGTINPATLPHEIEILRSIVRAMQEGKFECRPYLWIRLHPQVIRGVYGRSLEPFRALAGENVTVEEPPVQPGGLAWDLPRTDNEHLADLLAAADVVTTPCSTLSIDAACAQTPIINVFFDGDKPVHAQWSASRFRRYTHYEKILRTGGIAMAETIDDFVRFVDGYARDPTKDKEGRDAIIRQQLHRLDGQAGRRTASALLHLCNGGSRSSRRAHHA